MYGIKAQSKHWNDLLSELGVLEAECVSLSVGVAIASRCPTKSLRISVQTYVVQVQALKVSEDESFATDFTPLRKNEIWVSVFHL